MALTKYKLGELIYEITRRNDDLKYGIDYVRGVSNTKEIMPTKADVSQDVIHKFYVIMPGEFIYNPRTTRMGDKVGLAYNDTDTPLLFTFNNLAFAIREEAKNLILPDYLYIYFNRSEFDRYAIVNSWGSATELFTFEEMCDIDIELPPLPVQQKYVAIYKSMVANQQSYERGLEDLKLVCDAYIDQLKSKCPLITIGRFITQTDNRNTTNSPYHFKGLSMENYFIDSIANDVELDFTKYKIVEPNELACVLMKVGRDCRLTVAKNDSNETYIISPAYYTFTLHNINPEYFMVNVNRFEFERRAWFFCDSSARGSLSWTAFCNLEIPDASTEEQRIVACLQIAYKKRFNINERLKAQIKDLCPILVKGAVEEGEKT